MLSCKSMSFFTVGESAIASVAIVLVFFSVTITSAFATTGSQSSAATEGVSVVIDPDNARPGDIVEFRVEMRRETWGRFELLMPQHPQLRLLAEERIPVSYEDGLYRQRQSLMLQATSSGKIVIDGATVMVSTSNGQKTIELPDLTLNVQAFADVALSDSPLPLPPTEGQTHVRLFPWWITFAVGAAVVALVGLFCFFKVRPPESQLAQSQSAQSQSAQSWQTSSPTNLMLGHLRAGTIPTHDLERLLNDPATSISANLRSKIEQAVYSVQTDPVDLVGLLEKELPE